jgi:hypothetical protein
MATSPQSFDARSNNAMGSFSAVAQPKGDLPVCFALQFAMNLVVLVACEAYTQPCLKCIGQP